MNLNYQERKHILDQLQIDALTINEEDITKYIDNQRESPPSSPSSSTLTQTTQPPIDLPFLNLKSLQQQPESTCSFYIDVQNQLHWIRSPHSFYLTRKPNDDYALQIFKNILAQLKSLHLTVYTDPHDAEIFSLGVFNNQQMVDLAIVIGGDGSVLHASSKFNFKPPPIAAVNGGSLGFLSVLGADNLIQKLLTGPLNLVRRRRLVVRHKQHQFLSLNEIYIHRGFSAFLTNLLVFVNNRFIARIQADGLLISTPTGSTAYALSAGGVPVKSSVDCILLTPVCPHVMSSKQLILSDQDVITVKIDRNARASGTASVDGRQNIEIAPGESIHIFMQKAEDSLFTICEVEESVDFFKSLRDGLNWNVRVTQKGFGSTESRTYDIGDVNSDCE
eukprot:EST44456.1 ATP-NAD kinase family protein [Spironucleus salmonicida]